MTERDKKFIKSWTQKLNKGWLPYFLNIILFTCLLSAVAVLLYTWENIPENKFLESLGPLSILIFGMGIPIGLVIGWRSWTQKNYKCKFLTLGQKIRLNEEKLNWFENDKVWDILARNIVGVYFILFYISLFLFDIGLSLLLKYGMVGTILGYFSTLIGYKLYRFQLDKSGGTRIFPLLFKIAFSSIVLVTIIIWLTIFYSLE